MGKALTIIPARGGSKGIPRKNLVEIGGIPLVELTIKSALSANISGRICLTTDDEEIRDHGLRYPIEAPFLRPSELAADDVGSIPVIMHTLQWYEEKENYFPDLIVLLQPTCPFRKAETIKNAEYCIRSSDASSLISVNEVANHPCEYIMKTSSGFAYVLKPPARPGRQNFPKVYFINGAIYMVKREYFLQHKRLFDEYALLHVIPRHEAIDIDEPDDLDYARWVYDSESKQRRK
jgi:CMP-N,N'-diacetyllegionaminic acid synthase